jgi:hypothetical protein
VMLQDAQRFVSRGWEKTPQATIYNRNKYIFSCGEESLRA